MGEDSTLLYYEKQAAAFAENTVHVDFQAVTGRFAGYLQPGALVLDFGCGSGRDTKYFLEQGFQVEAMDGSEELCRFASDYTGIPVRHMLFQELEEVEKYDGIWACASILHVPKAELPEVIGRMSRALKDGGYIYTSFKYGIFEGERNGRYFTDLTEKSFAELLSGFPELSMVEQWISMDARPGREDEKWLNVILKKHSET